MVSSCYAPTLKKKTITIFFCLDIKYPNNHMWLNQFYLAYNQA